MNAAERQEKIERYGQGFGLLVQALREVPKEAMKFKPSAKDWSVHEIIIHLADSESNAALRARLLAAEPGRSLMAYDQDAWAEKLGYHDQDPEDALQVTRFARQTTYRWLKTLPEAVFAHTAHHPEYAEPYSFDQWLDIYSAHIPGHVEQIRSNLALWRETR